MENEILEQWVKLQQEGFDVTPFAGEPFNSILIPSKEQIQSRLKLSRGNREKERAKRAAKELSEIILRIEKSINSGFSGEMVLYIENKEVKDYVCHIFDNNVKTKNEGSEYEKWLLTVEI